MSAPAVKPALPAPSGAQAPRVGSGAPNTAPSSAPPGSATGAPKLSPGSVTVSPVKPSIATNANHAVSAAVPLSLVQEHKVPGNALPQPPMAMQRSPEKPKDLLAPAMTPPPGPKPTSNGVEGSPGKVPLPSVQLPPTVAENKKSEDALGATALLNHSTDSAAPASAAGPTSAPASTVTSNASVPANVPAVPLVASATSNTSLPALAHPPVATTQPSPSKAEPLVTPAAPTAAPPVPAPPAVVLPKSNTLASNSSTSSGNLPGKNEVVAAVATSASIVSESKPAANASVPADDPAPAPLPAAPASGPGPGVVSAPETLAKPTPPAPPEVTKTRIEISKPEFKVATPPRVSKRKRETKSVVETKSAVGDPNDDRKSKRVRTRTQPYQSPLPELTYIAKIKNLMKSADDKLIVFYKNEFLAVRNAEGSFYVCQAMQNIYKSSTRIRIRWLSQDKKENKETNVYIPDFYDATEFDCILTNLELKKLDKNKFQLPQEERERTQSILKRALDVEKGVAEKPPITEEHPDGLDLSLYRDEAQLKKKRSAPKASKKTKKASAKASKEGKSEGGETETSEESLEDAATGEEEEEEEDEDGGGNAEKKKAASKPPKSKASKKEKAAKAAPAATKEKSSKTVREKDGGLLKKERTSERGREREATKRRGEAPAPASNATAATAAAAAASAAAKSTAATKPPSEKKAKMAAAASSKPVRKADKPEPTAAATTDAGVPTRGTKSRSAKTAVVSTPAPSNKTSPVTRTKERERRAVTASSRKKPGKKA